MTQAEFLDKFRHEIGGMVLDGMERREGAHLAAFTRNILRKVDLKLTEIYLALSPPLPAKVPANPIANVTHKTTAPVGQTV